MKYLGFRRLSIGLEPIGPVIYMHVLGREFIILNTSRAVLDLFDRRSAMYSERPRLVMAGKMVGLEDSILFHQDNNSFREHRKLLKKSLSAQRASTYWRIQEIASWRLMAALIECPDDFSSLLRR